MLPTNTSFLHFQKRPTSKTWETHPTRTSNIKPESQDECILKTKRTQEEQMLKWSISATPTELLHNHLPNIINHHEHKSCLMQNHNRMTAQVFAFPDNHVTLSEHQVHSNWNQTVEWSTNSGVWCHKFETNQSTSIPTQDNVNLYSIKSC